MAITFPERRGPLSQKLSPSFFLAIFFFGYLAHGPFIFLQYIFLGYPAHGPFLVVVDICIFRAGLFTGHDPTHRSRREVISKSRGSSGVGLGSVWNLMGRVGTGRVGAGRL